VSIISCWDLLHEFQGKLFSSFDVHATTIDAEVELGLHTIQKENFGDTSSKDNSTSIESNVYQKIMSEHQIENQSDWESIYAKASIGRQKRNEAMGHARKILNRYLKEKSQTLLELETLEKKLIQMKLFLVREETIERREKLIWARDMDYYELLGDDLDVDSPAKETFEKIKKEAIPTIAEGEGLKKIMESSVQVGPVSMNLKQYFDKERLISEGKRRREEPNRNIKRKGTLLLAPMIERGYKGGREFFVFTSQILALPLTIPLRVVYFILKCGFQMIKIKDSQYIEKLKTLFSFFYAKFGMYIIFNRWEQEIVNFGKLCSNYCSICNAFFRSGLVSIQSNPLFNEIIVTFEEYLEPIQWFFESLWKGPLVVKSFLFPLTIKGYDRLEAALLRQGILLGAEELENQKRKYTQLIEREDNLNYGENQVYLTLKDKCFSVLNPTIKNTSTKLCHFSSLSIQDTENITTEENFIFSQWTSDRKEKALYVINNSDHHVSEASCSSDARNAVIVEYECHNEDTIRGVRKASPCQYILEFGTPLACTDKYINEIESKRKASGLEFPRTNKRRRMEANSRSEFYSRKKPFNTKSIGDEL